MGKCQTGNIRGNLSRGNVLNSKNESWSARSGQGSAGYDQSSSGNGKIELSSITRLASGVANFNSGVQSHIFSYALGSVNRPSEQFGTSDTEITNDQLQRTVLWQNIFLLLENVP